MTRFQRWRIEAIGEYDSQRRVRAAWEGYAIDVLMDMQTEEHVFEKVDERFVEA